MSWVKLYNGIPQVRWLINNFQGLEVWDHRASMARFCGGPSSNCIFQRQKASLLEGHSSGSWGLPAHDLNRQCLAARTWSILIVRSPPLFVSHSKHRSSLTTLYWLFLQKMLKKPTFSLVSRKPIQCFSHDIWQVDLIFPSLVSVFKMSPIGPHSNHVLINVLIFTLQHQAC